MGRLRAADRPREALVRCGCLNIAKRSVTPDLADTYAQLSHETLTSLGLRTRVLRRRGAARALRVPRRRHGAPRRRRRRGRPARRHRRADWRARRARRARPRGRRDDRRRARRRRAARGHRRRRRSPRGRSSSPPGTAPTTCSRCCPTAASRSRSRRDRPSEAKYFVPPAGARGRFTAGAMPVIAYLDTGIYCHPIVDGLVEAVKIGYYNPPDMPREHARRSTASQSFVEQCMPGLRDAEVRDVEDVDQCDYDLVADDDFVLGAGPGRRRRVRRRRLAGHRLQVRAVGGARAGRARRPGRHRLRHRPLRPGADSLPKEEDR